MFDDGRTFEGMACLGLDIGVLGRLEQTKKKGRAPVE